MDTPLSLGGKTFRSRLLVGTGKYPDYPTMVAALEASGAEIVTVAVRRVNLDRSKESLLDHIDPRKYTLLPNTAACFTADDAIRTCRRMGANRSSCWSAVLTRQVVATMPLFLIQKQERRWDCSRNCTTAKKDSGKAEWNYGSEAATRCFPLR